MSTVDYSFDDAVRLITDIGGYDPSTEAEDLLVKSEDDTQFNELLERRINKHEPVAYITNHCRFRNLRERIRAVSAPLEGDRALHHDISALEKLLAVGGLRQ